ncbi:hypothetical protein D9M73_238440 [compost metagenome]
MFAVLSCIHALADTFVVLTDFLQPGGDCLFIWRHAGADRHVVVRYLILAIDDDPFRCRSQGDSEQRALDRLDVCRLHVPAQVVVELAYAVLLDPLQLVQAFDLCLDCSDIALDVAAQHDDVIGLDFELALDRVHGCLDRFLQAFIIVICQGRQL